MARYIPRKPTVSQIAAAIEFQNPNGNVAAVIDNPTEWATTPEGQAALTEDSLRAIREADAVTARACASARAHTNVVRERVVDEPVQPKPDFELRPEQRPIENAKQFAFAGNALFTVVSRASGKRFTFKVRQPKPDSPHFVSVLSGADNTSDYTFVGSVFADGSYRHGRRSTISQDAPSAKAAQWFFTHLNDPHLTEQCDVYHEGRCCRCGRVLTVPSSIESGIGPECASKA